MLITSAERVLCWGQTILALETNAFRDGDEHFSAGDECLSHGTWNILVLQHFRASATHLHTATCSYQRLPSRIYVEMIAILVSATYPLNRVLLH